MHLKLPRTNVLSNCVSILTFGKYIVFDTLVGRAALKLNMGRLGDWLEGEPLRSTLQRDRAELPLAAKASHSKIKKKWVT